MIDVHHELQAGLMKTTSPGGDLALLPQVANGTGFLGIDASGRVFGVGDGPLLLFGNDIREALDNLVLGRKTREMPHPFR